jgi:tRNA (cmo5U34)-methyltransferase
MLASADLAAAAGSDAYAALLPLWQRVMSPADLSPEGLARMKAAYAQNVAILPPSAVAAIIAGGGFAAPIQFFQAGLLHAWFARAC